ncbi:hypothetical protein [Aeromonas sp. S19(2024)]|uniref:hypothetical protein n=1 Tax=Aeromonas sp. S19(2024) TaxID=3242892 RepID=UPI003528D9D3
MSDKTILEGLLVEIEAYDKNRNDRDAFAQREWLEQNPLGFPIQCIQQGRDWQYKIETEDYFDEEGLESEINEVISKLKACVNDLIQSHC